MISSKQEMMTLDSTLNSEDTQEVIYYPQLSRGQLALIDVKEGIQSWRIWLLLAYQDIKLRYRRSVLGPFWLTLSMAITVYSMGFLYGHLFHTDLQSYYPFLVAGMLSWSLIAGLITEYTDGFSDGLIKQIKLPYTLYIHRLATRNIIIFFHNFLVMIPIYILFSATAKINFYFFLIIPGLALIYLNAISYGLVIAMIGARFRDLSQVIKSLVQVIFFVTPVMWKPDVLGQQHHFVVDLNPCYALIELVRAPLLGHAPTMKVLFATLIVSLIGLLIASKMFPRYRSRIVYWI